MSNLTRYPVKFIRDYIKKDYKIRDCCFICEGTDTLEIHHLYSVSELFNNWCTLNKVNNIIDDDHIKRLRIEFANDLSEELSKDNLYTLCKKHHTQLHTVYGQRYSTHLVPKVKKWLTLQRDKNVK